MNQTIRDIVAAYGKLRVPVGDLGDGDDLFLAGMTSLNTVSVMLAIEDTLDIEFPLEFINRTTFQSIDALAGAVNGMRVEAA